MEPRRTPQHQTLQVVVIVGDQQYGGGLAVVRDDHRPGHSAIIQIGTKSRLYVRQGGNPHDPYSSLRSRFDVSSLFDWITSQLVPNSPKHVLRGTRADRPVPSVAAVL